MTAMLNLVFLRLANPKMPLPDAAVALLPVVHQWPISIKLNVWRVAWFRANRQRLILSGQTELQACSSIWHCKGLRKHEERLEFYGEKQGTACLSITSRNGMAAPSNA